MRRVMIAAALLPAVTPLVRRAEEARKELIGNWRFDGSEGPMVRDASGNGKNGSILNRGRGVRRVQGRSGLAVEFQGGDPKDRNQAGCVEIPKMGAHDFTAGITIELWVKFTRIDRPQTYELVSNTFSDRGKGFRLTLSWLQLVFRSGEGGAGKTWGAASSPAETKIRTGVWYHVATTYDGSVYRVYLDGVQVAASKPGLTMTKGRSTVCVGSYNHGHAYGLNGLIDDVKIYNLPRSPRQILVDAKFGF